MKATTITSFRLKLLLLLTALVWSASSHAQTRVFDWGQNSSGQLGNNSTNGSTVPVAVTATGVLAGKTVTVLAVGTLHTLALCSDGILAAWGSNDYGQLGNNSTTSSSVPVAVDRTGVLAGKTVIAVAAGESHSLALCSDGTVAAWGSNDYGQLGDNSTTGSTVPVAVDRTGVLAGKTVTAIAAGSVHSLAACSDGTVAAWGENSSGQLGDNSTTRTTVPVAVNRAGVLAGKTVSAVAGGYIHSLALCSDGTVAAWGENSYGQLGNNSTTSNSVPVAVARTGVLAGKTVTAIAAGDNHSLALCSDGTVAAWGENSHGQLGNNSTTSGSVPVAVTRTGVLAGKTVTAIATGYGHSLALCSDGTLAAWGLNLDGQLGNNSTSQSSVPVAVSTAPLAAGERFVGVGSGSGAKHSVARVAPAPAVPPTVTAISPSSGSTAGGQSVTITGTGFTGATGVTIGGAAATSVTVVNATSITCTTPAGTAGTASVVVTTPGGANPANTLFTYLSRPEMVIEDSGIALLTGATVGFGVQAVNSTTTKTFTIRNTGSAPLNITSVGLFNPAAPWQNAANPFDVNGDGSVSAVDVLIIINDINGDGPRALPAPTPGQSPPPYLDVDGDNSVTPSDAKQVINRLNGTISANPSPFSVSTAGMLTTVAPAGSTTYTVSFVPKSSGPKQLTLRITSNDSDKAITDLILVGGSPVPNSAPVVNFARPSVVVAQNAGAQSLPGFAAFNPGSPYESGQSLVGYTVTVDATDNPSLFSTSPAIANNGTLTFTPATSQSGTATIKVVVQDNGGTTVSGSVDKSTNTFTLTVVPAQFVVSDATQLNAAIAAAASGRMILLAGNINLSSVTPPLTKHVKLVAGSGAALTGTLQIGSGGKVDLGGANLPGASITVQSGGTLAGSGSFNGTLIVQTGGTVSPGASPGTITADTGTWAGGGSYDWEINNANGASGEPVSDLLVFNNTLTVTATSSDRFTVRVKTLTAANQPGLLPGFDPRFRYIWRIAQAGSVAGFAANAFTLDTSGFANSTAGGTFALRLSGGNLQVTFTPAPPMLAIMRGTGNATLSWVDPGFAFSLESTATPQVPASWAPVSATFTVSNGTNSIVVPTLPIPSAGARQFFRLKSF